MHALERACSVRGKERHAHGPTKDDDNENTLVQEGIAGSISKPPQGVVLVYIKVEGHKI